MASQLPRIFEQGAGFDVSAVDGFMNIEESDLLLFPDPSSLVVLPWRPSTGRVVRMYCNIRHPDGAPFVGDGRHLLRNTKRDALAMGLSCRFNTECEFYLFELDEESNPTLKPHDQAGYLDIAPLDRSEKVRREICLALEEMGLTPEASHHEKGPGQNEVSCRSADVVRAADDFITYKSVVRTIAAQNGLFACFMPKPLQGKSGNGLHINMSLHESRDGHNLFGDLGQESLLHSYMAGLLNHVAEMTLFLNPATNSYERFGSFDAPKYISWSQGNRAQLLRVPAGAGESSRVELRSPDPLCNPYLAFTLLLRAGMEGIEKKLPLSPPADIDFTRAGDKVLESYATLPESLGAAISLAENSAFIRRCLPEPIVEKTAACKQEEWEACRASGDAARYEHETYFSRI